MSSTVGSGAAEAPLRIVAGPTAAGKSALALAAAVARGAMIVSADSRQNAETRRAAETIGRGESWLKANARLLRVWLALGLGGALIIDGVMRLL